MELKRHISGKYQPNELFSELVKGNKLYLEENKKHFSGLTSGQAPDITLVTCCDSRVPPDVFGIDSLNEVFTIRNIGNQFRNSEGSIKYSLLHLKTPLLIIMGHTGCGAINAALGDYRAEDDGIQREVIGLTNSIRIGNAKDIEKLSGGDSVLKGSMFTEINVDHQVKKVITDYNLKPLVKDGSITVIGMVFDIHSVYEVSPAHVHVTNINGETVVDSIKKHKLLSKLTQEEKDRVVRRLLNGS